MRHTTPRHRDLVAALAVVSLLGPGTARAAGNVVLEAAASFHGEQAGEYVGEVSGLGDVNGDGLDDFYIGAWGAWGDAGAAYLFFGRQPLWALDTPIGEADAILHGDNPGEGVGYGRPQSAGDLNGDGLNDLVIDDIWNDDGGGNAGQVYVVYGKNSGWNAEIPLDEADASFLGENANDTAGLGRVLADLDGDGIDDMAIGASHCDGNRGCVYVVLSTPAGWAMGESLADADGKFTGEHTDDFACSLGGRGDVDGDGIDDLLVGAPGSDINGQGAGAAYIVPGDVHGWPVTATINDPLVLRASFLGETPGDIAGYSVAIVQDVDGDDLDEILIGAKHSSEAAFEAGQAYLILGRATGWAIGTDLGQADASFWGTPDSSSFAIEVADAGDLNGDGLHEVAVGSLFDSEFVSGGGQTFVWFGRSSGWQMDMLPTTADASFAGDEYAETSGHSLSSPGDVNGDGYDDLLVGATSNDEYGENSGAAYLILGTPCFDVDWDGVNACGGPAQDPDCDDTEPLTSPGAPEQCDGEDNDCDDEVDEGTDQDLDGDGFTACEGDCHGEDPVVFPGAIEACDGYDTDCDGVIPAEEDDVDQDGYLVCQGDCDDTRDDVHPDHEEICDDLDNNCDGEVDEGLLSTWYRDRDDDGWGDVYYEIVSCDPPAGFVSVSGDCNDDHADVHPGHEEICDDGWDNDCNGAADEGDEACDDFYEDDDSADDDDTTDDDTTEPPGNDCACRSQLTPGPRGGVIVALLALLAAARRRRS